MVDFFDGLFDAVGKGDALFVDAVVDLVQADHLTALLGGGDGVGLVGVGRVLKIVHHALASSVFRHRLYLASVDEARVLFDELQRHQDFFDDKTGV